MATFARPPIDWYREIMLLKHTITDTILQARSACFRAASAADAVTGQAEQYATNSELSAQWQSGPQAVGIRVTRYSQDGECPVGGISQGHTPRRNLPIVPSYLLPRCKWN